MPESRLFHICPECGSTEIAPDKYKELFKINEWRCNSCRHIWGTLEIRSGK